MNSLRKDSLSDPWGISDAAFAGDLIAQLDLASFDSVADYAGLVHEIAEAFNV